MQRLAALAFLSAASAKVSEALPVEDGSKGLGDIGWELLATSAGAEVPRTCFKAPGLPPTTPRGAFFIGGPAEFEIGPWSFQCLFDGFGRENRFEIRDREVCWTSAQLNTIQWRSANEAVAKGESPRGVIFEDTVPARPACPVVNPMCNLGVPNDNNWVNMIEVGGEALLLTDTHLMLRMDPGTMNVTGLKQWADDKGVMPGKPHAGETEPGWIAETHMALAGSAHPLKRPGTHELVTVLSEAPLVKGLGHSILDVYTIDMSVKGLQNRTRIASLKAPKNQYMHSFGVTENYVVLPFNIEMEMPSMTATPLMLGHILEAWTGIYLVDKQGEYQIFDDTKPFFHTHIVNSFENETGVVFDVGAYDSNPFVKGPNLDIGEFKNKALRDAAGQRAGVRRYHFHLAGPSKGTTTMEEMTHGLGSLDFFKINPALSGLPYCVFYALEWWHNRDTFANMAIVKNNLCTGEKKAWHREHVYPGEATFIPREQNGEEDDGMLVFIALDGVKRHSLFVVLDAKSFEELAVVDLPAHIPFTAHGHFIREATGHDAASTLIV